MISPPCREIAAQAARCGHTGAVPDDDAELPDPEHAKTAFDKLHALRDDMLVGSAAELAFRGQSPVNPIYEMRCNGGSRIPSRP